MQVSFVRWGVFDSESRGFFYLKVSMLDNLISMSIAIYRNFTSFSFTILCKISQGLGILRWKLIVHNEFVQKPIQLQWLGNKGTIDHCCKGSPAKSNESLMKIGYKEIHILVRTIILLKGATNYFFNLQKNIVNSRKGALKSLSWTISIFLALSLLHVDTFNCYFVFYLKLSFRFVS